MIYTDYFVKGRQPTTVCPLHPVPNGFATTISAGGQPQAAPGLPGAPLAAPAAPVGTAGAVQPAPAGPVTPPDDQSKKKRGFWGRIFGRGGGGV
jgi:hypothetical protein